MTSSAENVVEKVYRQLPPPKTLWEIWREKSKPLILVTERPKVIALSRRLGKCAYPPRVLHHVGHKGHRCGGSIDSRTLQTASSLCMERVVLARLSVLHPPQIVPMILLSLSTSAVTLPKLIGERVSEMLKRWLYVMAKVEAVLGHRPGVTCTTTTRVIIILDEMGEHPQLARGICAARAAIADEIRDYLVLKKGTPAWKAQTWHPVRSRRTTPFIASPQRPTCDSGGRKKTQILPSFAKRWQSRVRGPCLPRQWWKMHALLPCS